MCECVFLYSVRFKAPAGLSELEMSTELCVCTVEGFGLSEPLNM